MPPVLEVAKTWASVAYFRSRNLRQLFYLIYHLLSLMKSRQEPLTPDQDPASVQLAELGNLSTPSTFSRQSGRGT